MINFICGMIVGSGITLIAYSLAVANKISEEQEKATKCIYKYDEYRKQIHKLEYEKRCLENRIKAIKSFDYSDFDEVK